jgi:hypothetical protein
VVYDKNSYREKITAAGTVLDSRKIPFISDRCYMLAKIIIKNEIRTMSHKPRTKIQESFKNIKITQRKATAK